MLIPGTLRRDHAEVSGGAYDFQTTWPASRGVASSEHVKHHAAASGAVRRVSEPAEFLQGVSRACSHAAVPLGRQSVTVSPRQCSAEIPLRQARHHGSQLYVSAGVLC